MQGHSLEEARLALQRQLLPKPTSERSCTFEGIGFTDMDTYCMPNSKLSRTPNAKAPECQNASNPSF